jgi:hypothetical protein
MLTRLVLFAWFMDSPTSCSMRPIVRGAALLAVLLTCNPLPALCFFEPVTHQNHRPVSEGAHCVPANLPVGDFCADVVSYPVSSRLLYERVEDGVLSPVHKHEEHGALLRENRLDLVLTPRAQAEFDMLRAAHEQAGAIAESLPGGSRHRAAAVEGADPDEVANMPLPGQAECDAVLRRYACQNQFPRCVDNEAYVHESSGRPLQLHTCYALCHEATQRCHLRQRVDCSAHHARLDPQHTQPSAHELKFDARFKDIDPTAKFWHVDCIDSPPSRVKHSWSWFVHGGPAMYLAYSAAALVLYALASAAMGLRGESATRVLLRVRRERRHRRALFDATMRRAQKRFVKLQEIKTALLDAQEADTLALQDLANGQGSPGIRTALAERASKLVQLDNLLAQLEAHVEAARARMQAARLREVREDVAAGRLQLDAVPAARLREYVQAGAGGPLSLASTGDDMRVDPADSNSSDALAVAEALAHEEEEEARLLGRADVLLTGSPFSPDEEEDADDDDDGSERQTGLQSLGRRRPIGSATIASSPQPQSIRRSVARSAASGSPASPPQPSKHLSPLSSSPSSIFGGGGDDEDEDEYDMAALESPAPAPAATSRSPTTTTHRRG